MLNFFRRLQWKLTLSYAVVTAGTVIVLTTLLVAIAVYFENQNNSRTFESFYWSKTGFQDNIPYLLDDPQALQKWLERVQKTGFNWKVVLQESASLSLFAERRIIDVRVSGAGFGREGAEVLTRYARQPGADTLLLIRSGRLDSKQRNAAWYKALAQAGVVMTIWPAQYWARLNHNKVPVNAVIASAVVALVLTLPALIEINIGTEEEPIIVNYAFAAVVSIGVIGLYLAFAIPIWLRWRMGDAFKQGEWNLGNKWKWMAPLAIAEIAITSVYFVLPATPAGWPNKEAFDWKFVNYAPILTLGSLLLLWIGWHMSAKKWFTGPKTTIDLPAGVSSADEIALEHEHKGYHQPPGT